MIIKKDGSLSSDPCGVVRFYKYEEKKCIENLGPLQVHDFEPSFLRIRTTSVHGRRI